MAEHRYVLLGNDRCGPFYEQRSNDPVSLLKDRDAFRRKVKRAEVLYEVIDVDAVDPSSRGEVEWCDECNNAAIVGADERCADCEAGLLSEDHSPIAVVPHRRWPSR